MIRVMVIMMMVFALPALAVAQDAAGDVPTTTADPTLGYVLFTVVLLAILATVVAVGRPLVKYAGENAPAWAFELGVRVGRGMIDTAADLADATPVPYDDPVVAALRQEFERLVAEARQKGVSRELPPAPPSIPPTA